MSNFNDPAQWQEYLAEFSQRNQARPARFERFADNEVAEEEQLTLLESVTVQMRGEGAPRLTVTRRDHTASDQHKLTDTIAHVRAISPEFDQDGSEFGLKVADERNVMVVLRLRSRMDGDS